MWKRLGMLNKSLTVAILSIILVGIAFGLLVDATFLKHLILPFTFLMVYPVVVTLISGKSLRAETSKHN